MEKSVLTGLLSFISETTVSTDEITCFAKNPKQILLRTIVSEEAFFCKQLSPGILLQFFQKLFVFPSICIYMHIFNPRTRFTTSNKEVYLNPDLHWACLCPLVQESSHSFIKLLTSGSYFCVRFLYVSIMSPQVLL